MEEDSLLQQYFGFRSFRSGQKEAVQNILSGNNTLVIMPTGAGKSLIYQYAALVLRGQSSKKAAVTLVISPLIALMKDQVDSLQGLGIAATYINSTLQAGEQRLRSKQMLQGEYKLVYVAPERLRQNSFVEALKSIEIQLLVIDEAHCISSWGHDFRPDYRRISEARKELGQPLTVALTATATTLVQDDIVQLLDMPGVSRVVTGFNRPNLSFEVLYASGAHAKLQELASLLQEQFAQASGSAKENGACIIYAATRKEVEEVASFIGQNLALPCAFYHAGMGSAQREKIQDAFSLGKLSVVVATNAFGMGIDRQDVRLVLHYNLPGTLEAYYQEAGRAGRDGLPARAVLMFSPQDRSLQYFFIRQSSLSSKDLYSVFLRLRNLSPQGDSSVRLCRPPELARSLGWDSQKLRMALAYLERARILQSAEFALLDGEDGALRLILGEWDEAGADATTRQLEEYSSHRRSQLEQMCHYAQEAACRREILLSYFSDHSASLELNAERCCDYCHRQKLRKAVRTGGDKDADSRPKVGGGNALQQLSRAERAALIILDSVRQLAQKGVTVGRQRIAQMLSGSRSQKMTETFRSLSYYGRLEALPQKKIEAALGELLQSGFLQHRSLENSTISVIALTEQGSEALQQREAIALQAFCDVEGSSTASEGSTGFAGKRLQFNAISTTAETLRLLQQNLSLEQVAQQRGLNPRTISSHAASLIEQGSLELDDYVSAEVRRTVETCLRQLQDSGSDLQRLRPIKDLLPQKISYDELKFVLGAWRRQHN